jgi:ligand-binding sensor domain-containing protein
LPRLPAVARLLDEPTTPDTVKHIVLLIIVNTLWAADATAQSMSRHDVFGRYQQVIWQERDGLPQNTVLAIATTRDGYLWEGTYEGAARFDGLRFTLFNRSTTTGIGNSMVVSLLEARDGGLWLATYGGGVSRFSGGRFTQYAMRDGLSSDFTTCLFEDRAGTLWIGTEGGGVSAFSRGRFTRYASRLKTINGIEMADGASREPDKSGLRILHDVSSRF